MANLIPPAAQTRVKREYWARTISMWMLLVATACLMVAALQVPVYILIKDQTDVFATWYNEVSGEHDQFKEYTEQIRRTNEVSAFLNQEKEQLLFTELIAKVRSLSSEEITISSYNMDRKNGQVESFSVIGQADSRAGLAGFKNQLESDPMFTSAVLPLSNLAKDTDIPFNITVVVANTETEHD